MRFRIDGIKAMSWAQTGDNLHKTALYIAVTLHITVTEQLPKFLVALYYYVFCKVDLYM